MSLQDDTIRLSDALDRLRRPDTSCRDQQVRDLVEHVEELEHDVENLQIAVESNRHIGAAVGIVMARLQLQEDEAFAVLKRISQCTNTKLRDVATEIIETGAVPSPGPGNSCDHGSEAQTGP